MNWKPIQSREENFYIFLKNNVPYKHNEENKGEYGRSFENFTYLRKMIFKPENKFIIYVEFIPNVDIETYKPNCYYEKGGSSENGKKSIKLVIFIISS